MHALVIALVLAVVVVGVGAVPVRERSMCRSEQAGRTRLTGDVLCRHVVPGDATRVAFVSTLGYGTFSLRRYAESLDGASVTPTSFRAWADTPGVSPTRACAAAPLDATTTHGGEIFVWLRVDGDGAHTFQPARFSPTTLTLTLYTSQLSPASFSPPVRVETLVAAVFSRTRDAFIAVTGRVESLDAFVANASFAVAVTAASPSGNPLALIYPLQLYGVDVRNALCTSLSLLADDALAFTCSDFAPFAVSGTSHVVGPLVATFDASYGAPHLYPLFVTTSPTTTRVRYGATSQQTCVNVRQNMLSFAVAGDVRATRLGDTFQVFVLFGANGVATSLQRSAATFFVNSTLYAGRCVWDVADESVLYQTFYNGEGVTPTNGGVTLLRMPLLNATDPQTAPLAFAPVTAFENGIASPLAAAAAAVSSSSLRLVEPLHFRPLAVSRRAAQIERARRVVDATQPHLHARHVRVAAPPEHLESVVPTMLARRAKRIIGGTLVGAPSDAPHACLVLFNYGTASSHVCDCSIVSPRRVLTAAHCLPTGNVTLDARFTAPYYVFAGATNLFDPAITMATARRSTTHPSWLGAQSIFSGERADVGVIFLDAPLALNNVTLRAIDVSRDAADARDGTRVAFYGWGAAVPLAPFSVDLRTFNATIRAPHISGTYRKFHLDSGASMQRACSGDSGGGAVVYAPTPRLVGVMSLGRDCATETNVNYVVDTLPLAAWLAATASFTLFPKLYPAPPPATLGAPPHNGDITPFWDGARTETYVLSLDDDGATPRSRVLTALNVYARGSPRCAPPIDAPINCTARLAARWPDVFSV